MGEQNPIRKRHERRALPASGHVAHAKVRHSRDACPFRDHARLTDLKCGRRLGVRQMMNCLSMRTDGGDLRRLEFRQTDCRQRRASEVFAQHEVQLTNLSHMPVQTSVQHAGSKRRRKFLVNMRKQLRPQTAP